MRIKINFKIIQAGKNEVGSVELDLSNYAITKKEWNMIREDQKKKLLEDYIVLCYDTIDYDSIDNINYYEIK